MWPRQQHRFRDVARLTLLLMASWSGVAFPKARCDTEPLSAENVRAAAAQALRVPLSQIPQSVVPVTRFGACPNDWAPDAIAIERAANDLDGVLVYFPAGRYIQDKSIVIRRSDVLLFGERAVFDATNPSDNSLALVGDRASAVNLTLHMSGWRERSSGMNTVRLRASGDGNRIVGNKIRGSRGAAIALFGARDFQVARNVISDTAADGIHVTRGSSRGEVDANRISRTGDDLIAVVSYRRSRGDQDISEVQDIVIRHNVVGPNSWGRGISVVGGTNITIIDNIIKDNAAGAGILIAQEKSYGTFGVRNVVVERNMIENNQVGAAPRGRAGHTGILVQGSVPGREEGVRNVTIKDNTVMRARYGAFSAKGNVCGVQVGGLKVDGVTSAGRNSGAKSCSQE